ncbi:MAG: glycosyltransferase family 2 protein [Neisseriaceae bacterium]|nr:glycosyltransferase family 2 protein [Neisseriaceae bacterium]
MKIAVVIPAYKVSKHISEVIRDIPDFVNHIIVVDDKCPQDSGKLVDSFGNPKVIVCYHQENQGVGGAVATGYKKALALDVDIVVKIDGDGQMDISYMQKLIQPLIDERADYAKGNRFKDFTALRTMPKVRLIGNSGLSFLITLFSV